MPLNQTLLQQARRLPGGVEIQLRELLGNEHEELVAPLNWGMEQPDWLADDLVCNGVVMYRSLRGI